MGRFEAPEKWAANLVARHGCQKASEIANAEARPIYGDGDLQQINHSAGYFLSAFNWIKNRYGIKIYKQPQKGEGKKNGEEN